MVLSHRKRSDQELINFSMRSLRLRLVGLFNCSMFSDHVLLQTQSQANQGVLHALEKVAVGNFGSFTISRALKLQGTRNRQLELLT